MPRIFKTTTDTTQELIWSGAHLYKDRSTFDFKVTKVDGADLLSFVVMEDPRAELPGGAGIVLDSSYNTTRLVTNDRGRGTANMHEFSLIDNGRHALWITFASTLTNVRQGSSRQDYRWVGNNGFVEIDVETGKPVFEWWAMDHVHPSESYARQPPTKGAYANPWDYL